MRRMTQRVRLDSSAIEAVRYKKRRGHWMSSSETDIRNRYMHVPECVYRELLNTDSPGAFWNTVKDQFEYMKLD